MLANPSLLVVDDEPLYCEACRRIFSTQGFRVDQSNDAGRGLDLAQENDYAAILLDVKMPTMNGIEFLERLRTKKPDVPVILMTGFPSIPNAASAVRLRASDYVTKPFTPEEITKAVHHLIGAVEAATVSESGSAAWQPASPEFWFHAESWFQAGVDGTIHAGAALAKSKADSVTEVRLPRIGEVVFQGLPMLALTVRDPSGNQSLVSVPAPLSGVVVAVNPAVAEDPAALSRTPLEEAWAVCVAPTRREAELESCKPRRIVLLNRDPQSAGRQSENLRGLGCLVQVASDWNELVSLLPPGQDALLVVDAASLGDEGPSLVSRIKAEAPDAKILVVASRGTDSETDYRQRRIFYYAVEPFADGEITEILHAAFCPELRAASQRPGAKVPSHPVHAVQMTNRRGHRLCLLMPDGFIETGAGLGASLQQAATDLRIPFDIYLGNGPLAPADILKAATMADRVFVLMVKDVGRTPGCLVHSAKGEYDWASGDTAEKVSSLTIQPDASGTLANLPPATVAALAARIMDDLASV